LQEFAVTKKRLLVVLGVITAVLAIGAVLYLSPSLGMSFRARCNRVRLGMTEHEVWAIMEGPWQGPCPQVVYLNGPVAHEWYGDNHGMAHFDYDQDGKLTAKRCDTYDWVPCCLEIVREKVGL
jgi:hypothetical protein